MYYICNVIKKINKIMKYIKTVRGDIYKRTSNKNVYLKMSPWDINEDRRLQYDELKIMIDNGEASVITQAKAREELNVIWRETKRHWIYGNNYFKSEGTVLKKSPKIHKWVHRVYNHYLEKQVVYEVTWQLCMFQGKIYWYKISQYYPRVELVEFDGIDIEPTYSKTVRWTNIKNLKPIYKKEHDGKWVVI